MGQINRKNLDTQVAVATIYMIIAKQLKLVPTCLSRRKIKNNKVKIQWE